MPVHCQEEAAGTAKLTHQGRVSGQPPCPPAERAEPRALSVLRNKLPSPAAGLLHIPFNT